MDYEVKAGDSMKVYEVNAILKGTLKGDYMSMRIVYPCNTEKELSDYINDLYDETDDGYNLYEWEITNVEYI